MGETCRDCRPVADHQYETVVELCPKHAAPDLLAEALGLLEEGRAHVAQVCFEESHNGNWYRWREEWMAKGQALLARAGRG